MNDRRFQFSALMVVLTMLLLSAVTYFTLGDQAAGLTKQEVTNGQSLPNGNYTRNRPAKRKGNSRANTAGLFGQVEM